MANDTSSDYVLSSKSPSADRLFFLLLLFLTVISLVRIWNSATGALDLAGDEAHYWEWSRRPDLSYYSKPPGVSYLIMFGTAVFGDTVLGVRIPAIILSFLSSLVLYKLGAQLYNKTVGLVCGVSIQIVPLFTACGIGMTPDSPLMFFWILSLLFFHRALVTGSPWAWLAFAVSLGLGLLNKYAIAFFYIPVLVMVGLFPQNRRHLAKPWFYIAFLLSLLFFMPVVVWNSRHDWVTFRHDLGHANATDGFAISFGTLANFLSSQAGVITPLVLVFILYAVIKYRKRDSFCFWFCVPILAIFLLKSLHGKVQANWTLVAYVTGLISFSAYMVENYRGLSRFPKLVIIAGVGMAAAASILLHCPQITTQIRLPSGRNPWDRMLGWKQLGREVTAMSRDLQKPFFIFSDSYMTSSELAFYVEGHPTTYCANLGRRMNQYDIWPGFYGLVHYNAIYVSAGPMAEKLTQAFEQCQTRPLVLYDKRGRKIKEFQVYLCYDFRGMTFEEPTRF